MSPKTNTVKSAYINHLGLVRGRFQGEGSLLITAFSLNQKAFYECASVILDDDPDKFIETLANFKKQKMQVEFAVDEIDEWFDVGEIIPFIKPTESGYPR